MRPTRSPAGALGGLAARRCRRAAARRVRQRRPGHRLRRRLGSASSVQRVLARAPAGPQAAGEAGAWRDDVRHPGRRRHVFADQKVVVTQPTAGDFKCFTAVCTHQGCIVATVSDGTINCACHGSQYSIEDGDVEHRTGDVPARRGGHHRQRRRDQPGLTAHRLDRMHWRASAGRAGSAAGPAGRRAARAPRPAGRRAPARRSGSPRGSPAGRPSRPAAGWGRPARPARPRPRRTARRRAAPGPGPAEPPPRAGSGARGPRPSAASRSRPVRSSERQQGRPRCASPRNGVGRPLEDVPAGQCGDLLEARYVRRRPGSAPSGTAASRCRPAPGSPVRARGEAARRTAGGPRRGRPARARAARRARRSG